MSDTEPTAAAATPVAESAPAAPAAETAEVDYRAEAEKWKALSRQNEAQAKANAEKAREFDALQEANKTELQKAIEAAEAANQRATAAEQRALKAEIARTKNVPVDLLTGTDEDSLNASADALLAFLGSQKPVPAVGGVGVNGSAAPVIYDRAQLADPAFYRNHRDDILKAQTEGRIRG